MTALNPGHGFAFELDSNYEHSIVLSHSRDAPSHVLLTTMGATPATGGPNTPVVVMCKVVLEGKPNRPQIKRLDGFLMTPPQALIEYLHGARVTVMNKSHVKVKVVGVYMVRDANAIRPLANLAALGVHWSGLKTHPVQQQQIEGSAPAASAGGAGGASPTHVAAPAPKPQQPPALVDLQASGGGAGGAVTGPVQGPPGASSAGAAGEPPAVQQAPSIVVQQPAEPTAAGEQPLPALTFTAPSTQQQLQTLLTLFQQQQGLPGGMLGALPSLLTASQPLPIASQQHGMPLPQHLLAHQAPPAQLPAPLAGGAAGGIAGGGSGGVAGVYEHPTEKGRVFRSKKELLDHIMVYSDGLMKPYGTVFYECSVSHVLLDLLAKHGGRVDHPSAVFAAAHAKQHVQNLKAAADRNSKAPPLIHGMAFLQAPDGLKYLYVLKATPLPEPKPHRGATQTRSQAKAKRKGRQAAPQEAEEEGEAEPNGFPNTVGFAKGQAGRGTVETKTRHPHTGVASAPAGLVRESEEWLQVPFADLMDKACEAERLP